MTAISPCPSQAPHLRCQHQNQYVYCSDTARRFPRFLCSQEKHSRSIKYEGGNPSRMHNERAASRFFQVPADRVDAALLVPKIPRPQTRSLRLCERIAIVSRALPSLAHSVHGQYCVASVASSLGDIRYIKNKKRNRGKMKEYRGGEQREGDEEKKQENNRRREVAKRMNNF